MVRVVERVAGSCHLESLSAGVGIQLAEGQNQIAEAAGSLIRPGILWVAAAGILQVVLHQGSPLAVVVFLLDGR